MHGKLCTGPADRQMVLDLLPRTRNRTRHANGASTYTSAPNCFTWAFTGYNYIFCNDTSGSENIWWSYEGATTGVKPTLIQTAAHESDPIPTPPFERTSPTPSEGPSPTTPPYTIVVAIVGAVGGFAILAIFVLCLVWLLRRNKKNKPAAGAGGDAYVGMLYEQKPELQG